MNFASKAAFLQASEDDGEEVYEDDLNVDLPEEPKAVAPPQRGQFGALPSISEANEDMMRSSLFGPPPAREEAKQSPFASLGPGSSFSSSLAGKNVQVVHSDPSKPQPHFSSLSAGSGFTASLQGKRVNLVQEQPSAAVPVKFSPSPAAPQQPAFGSAAVPQQPAFGSAAVPQQPVFRGAAVPQQPVFGGAAVPQQPVFRGAAVPQQPMFGGAAVPQRPVFMGAGPPVQDIWAPPQVQSAQGPMFAPPPMPPKFGAFAHQPPPVQVPAQQFVPPARRRAQCQVFKQQVDSNVVDIPLNVLKEETSIATGDPQFCTKCRSLLNSTSTLSPIEVGTYRWNCEFCGQENHVNIDEEEVPKGNKVTYVLESAAEVAQAKVAAVGSTVLYVVDTSGSMCVTQSAPGHFALKTNRAKAEFEGILMGDDGDQYFPGQDRNLTYISRLECVQAAIESQLTELAVSSPELHVGLLTFDEEVRIIGDGRHEVAVTGDKLSSVEDCLREVEGKYQYYLGRSVAETKELLLGKVMAMREKGATALGPAALMAVALAKEGGPGSKVILCTDGVANVGLGSLDADPATSLAFYQQVSELAKEASVSISVISIEGEECRLNALLPLAVNTGGDVNKVNPLRLKDDFANILATKTVATDVEITVNLHKALKFRNADPATLQQGGSRLVKKVGTVAENETFIFEYCTKSKKELQESATDVTGLKQVPFQVMVRYQRSDGMRCVFVDTEVQKVTNDREAALQSAEFDLLARNAQMVSSNLVMEGRYQEAQVNSMAWGQAMFRNQQSGVQSASVQDYFQGSAPLYNQVRQELSAQPQGAQPQPMQRMAQQDTMALAAHKQQKFARKQNFS